MYQALREEDTLPALRGRRLWVGQAQARFPLLGAEGNIRAGCTAGVSHWTSQNLAARATRIAPTPSSSPFCNPAFRSMCDLNEKASQMQVAHKSKQP